MYCIDSDCLEVERHRHENQTGESDCARSDQNKEISPLPRPENIGSNHDPIASRDHGALSPQPARPSTLGRPMGSGSCEAAPDELLDNHKRNKAT
jgi:hypothetical protein